MIMKKLMIVLTGMFLSIASAQIQPTQTRVIFKESAGNSQSLTIKNGSSKEAYLAQSWIQDDKGNKVVSPLIVLPMLQRVDPKQEKMIKLNLSGSTANLPKDRESLYYLNLLGVPAESELEGQMNVVVRSESKIFYRPKALPKYSEDMGWLKELELVKNRNGLTLTNPSAYHIVIYGFNPGKKAGMVQRDVILAPFSTETVNVNIPGNTVAVYIINDYGAAERIQYNCSNTPCTLLKVERI